jgi:cytochrome c biogenesis factor
MTFEGRNFDILSGISAPFIAYFGFNKRTLSRKTLLVWNVVCLALVLQVVVTGILSAPSAIQQFSFDQPNYAILIFPFVWLPGIVVPIVIFGHLTSIKRLANE